MDTRFPYSPADVAKVRTVQFGILSPDEIVTTLDLRYLVAKISFILMLGLWFAFCVALAAANVSRAGGAR